MKKILILLTLLCSVTFGYSQTWMTQMGARGYWWKNGRFDSTVWFNGILKLPGVTAFTPQVGAIRYNTSDSSIEHYTGFAWRKELSAQNFANTDLSFTGNRYHNAKGYALTIDSTSNFWIKGRPSLTGYYDSLFWLGKLSGLNEPAAKFGATGNSSGAMLYLLPNGYMDGVGGSGVIIQDKDQQDIFYLNTSGSYLQPNPFTRMVAVAPNQQSSVGLFTRSTGLPYVSGYSNSGAGYFYMYFPDAETDTIAGKDWVRTQVASAPTPSLQTTTDVDDVTNHRITADGFTATGDVVIGGMGSGAAIEMNSDGTNSFITRIQSTQTANRTRYLADATGNEVLSVQGQTANSSGAITIPAITANTDSITAISARTMSSVNSINGNTAAIGLKAPIASPTFTGTVTIPTPFVLGAQTVNATGVQLNYLNSATGATGSGSIVYSQTPSLVTPILGTPTSVTLTNATGLPISTGVSGLGTGVATFLATPSSANLASALTDETGTGVAVFGTSPAITTSITTPSSTFSLVNSTPTTVNAFGAATTLNIGAASGTWNIGSNSTINGGTAANDDITIQGTSNATRTTSYVILQPNGGNVGIGTSSPNAMLHVAGSIRLSGPIEYNTTGDFAINNQSGTSTSLYGTFIRLRTTATDPAIIVSNAGLLQFQGTTSLFPSFKRSGTTIQARLADDSEFGAVQSLYDRFGSGSPEGVVAAPVGAIYHRTDGGTGTAVYFKETGTTTSTGWVTK